LNGDPEYQDGQTIIGTRYEVIDAENKKMLRNVVKELDETRQ